MTSQRELSELAIKTIRGLSMDAVQAANSGHPGTPMALAPLGWVLFSQVRRHDPAHPEWPDRDRFVLSCGHASMLQYALLHLSGYGLSLDDIRQFRQWGSLTPGHPEVHHTPGVETTTGPLGQGLATAVGMAMAERHLAARFNRDGHTLFDHHTWVLASDGDLMEGVAAEAASLAGHLRLGKLVVFWDDNRITIDGGTDLSFTEDVLARFAAYGWHTDEVPDGNDVDALARAAEAARAEARPSLVRVRTVIGDPAPNKQGSSDAHGAPLGADEVAATKEIMGWPQTPFHVPTELAAATEAIRARGRELHGGWAKRLEAYGEAHPTEAADLGRVLEGRLPDGWEADLPRFDADPKGVATRKASGKVLAALTPRLPELCGGSADLAGSNNTALPDQAAFHEVGDDGQRVPRVVAWGVREHAMGAAVNGMALHGGVIPFGATFLIFSDYMRPALRLAALMGTPTRYVFTHDSIGLGEDGPTHQPIEHLASLRAIPGFTVLRPADANEVSACWRVALERKGPAALVLTRQNLPVLDRSNLASAEGVRRGAYVLADADGELSVILIASGSEVPLALEARDLLEEEGLGTRVVSMPSWELFEEQDPGYRGRVLPRSVKARVAVEAGVRQGWERYVGPDGGFVTLERFGASAPAKTLFEKLGFTPSHVAEVARETLTRTR
jgi:transketolase